MYETVGGQSGRQSVLLRLVFSCRLGPVCGHRSVLYRAFITLDLLLFYRFFLTSLAGELGGRDATLRLKSLLAFALKRVPPRTFLATLRALFNVLLLLLRFFFGGVPVHHDILVDGSGALFLLALEFQVLGSQFFDFLLRLESISALDLLDAALRTFVQLQQAHFLVCFATLAASFTFDLPASRLLVIFLYLAVYRGHSFEDRVEKGECLVGY